MWEIWDMILFVLVSGNNKYLVVFYIKPFLEKLTNKLRTVNGDIKDPRAAFMNRTKVQYIIDVFS